MDGTFISEFYMLFGARVGDAATKRAIIITGRMLQRQSHQPLAHSHGGILMRNAALAIVSALVISVATAWITPSTDEKAMYGHEGSMQENWLPREIAGWPAPFLADNPGTSVIHKVGLEDQFRPGPFIATFSFWFLVIATAGKVIRRIISTKVRP